MAAETKINVGGEHYLAWHLPIALQGRLTFRVGCGKLPCFGQYRHQVNALIPLDGHGVVIIRCRTCRLWPLVSRRLSRSIKSHMQRNSWIFIDRLEESHGITCEGIGNRRGGFLYDRAHSLFRFNGPSVSGASWTPSSFTSAATHVECLPDHFIFDNIICMIQYQSGPTRCVTERVWRMSAPGRVRQTDSLELVPKAAAGSRCSR
jgi:hypothetical protein